MPFWLFAVDCLRQTVLMLPELCPFILTLGGLTTWRSLLHFSADPLSPRRQCTRYASFVYSPLLDRSKNHLKYVCKMILLFLWWDLEHVNWFWCCLVRSVYWRKWRWCSTSIEIWYKMYSIQNLRQGENLGGGRKVIENRRICTYVKYE